MQSQGRGRGQYLAWGGMQPDPDLSTGGRGWGKEQLSPDLDMGGGGDREQ